ncbi:10639_t:CDS:1 [Cetraspora pellucida]|uniref:10639_t:CDS:1 n=1 Tax=Cetraspora pellucida TaxID=1433469 RepID=A0ACA9KD78_9GLOM|nr:10639_t:CDS:1 [Cetraspora pellucida]
MSLCQRQRGPYVTRACTNCQQRHAKCSGSAACQYCSLHGLECNFISSNKRRGPKRKREPRKKSKSLEKNYVPDNPENKSNEVSTQPILIHNHAFQDNNDIISYSNSYDELQDVHTFQEIAPFVYQIRTDTDYVMQSNHSNLYACQ